MVMIQSFRGIKFRGFSRKWAKSAKSAKFNPFKVYPTMIGKNFQICNVQIRLTEKLKLLQVVSCYVFLKLQPVKIQKKILDVRKMISLARNIQFQFVLSWNNEFSLFIPSDKKDKKTINFHVCTIIV